jgi:DNA-directed RNA polymerase subunit M/transcription elongation factor TFIIS
MQPQPPTMQTDDQERDLRAALAARLTLFEADECGFMRPKCKSQHIRREYKAAVQHFRRETVHAGYAEVTTIGGDLPEHMLVTCVACGYAWLEQCADAAGQKARTDSGATQKLGPNVRVRLGEE